MKRHLFARPLAAAAIAIVFAAPADAGTRNHSGSYHTSGGRSGTYQGQVERSPGATDRQGSVTTADGKTYSRSASGTYDRGTGAVNRSATGVDGRTRTAAGTYNRGTQTYDRTVTGAKGRQAHAVTAYDKAAKSASTTVTGPNGKTATSQSTYDAANKGIDTTATGPNGRTATRSTINRYDKESGTLSHSVTNPAGQTRSVDVTPAR